MYHLRRKGPVTGGVLTVHPSDQASYNIYTEKEIEKAAIMELLLQAYYCLKFYDLDEAVLCLTDAFTAWHYFKIIKNIKRGPKLRIEWYFRLYGEMYMPLYMQ